LVPTRELVLQVVENFKDLTKYTTLRVLGVYGGTNINTQKQAVVEGCDIVVATPGRLFDLAVTKVLKLGDIKKLVIDEVDVMMDLGFLPQLSSIFEMLPNKRQNLMFSATMTLEVDELINEYFSFPKKISIALSGTPLDNISQKAYAVPNFYTKINLLNHLLRNKAEFHKVLVFMPSKKTADQIFEALEEDFAEEICVIHSNKSQNYRERAVKNFDGGEHRIMIATDVMARGLDLDKLSHVISFDTPYFPENYMHRIGRTGRAKEEGNSILFFTETEEKSKTGIERLMDYQIPTYPLPDDVEVSRLLTPEERPQEKEINSAHKKIKVTEGGGAFHEKKEKNLKTNQGGSYKRKIKGKYKKPISKGDKIGNKKHGRKKR
jgi:ATP-dependent RNA helicase RhlE